MVSGRHPKLLITTDGFTPHPRPSGLPAGKKRLDKCSAPRGQVIMWHRFLTDGDMADEREASGLSGSSSIGGPRLKSGPLPTVPLETRVPEEGWGGGKRGGRYPVGTTSYVLAASTVPVA